MGVQEVHSFSLDPYQERLVEGISLLHPRHVSDLAPNSALSTFRKWKMDVQPRRPDQLGKGNPTRERPKLTYVTIGTGTEVGVLPQPGS
jgi:hypothetical protein